MKFYDLEVGVVDGSVVVYETIMDEMGGNDEKIILPPDQAIIVGREIVRLAKELKRQQAGGAR